MSFLNPFILGIDNYNCNRTLNMKNKQGFFKNEFSRKSLGFNFMVAGESKQSFVQSSVSTQNLIILLSNYEFPKEPYRRSPFCF